MQTDPRNELLHGVIAAEAALQGGKREVFRVWLDRQRDDTAARRLKKACKQNGVRYSPTSRTALDDAAGGDGHGGVIAEVGPRTFEALDALLSESGRVGPDTDDQNEPENSAATPAPPPHFLAMLDGVEDPFNFGQAVRALYAAGCTGLIFRPRNWTTAAAVVARASAGATERIAMAVAEGPEDAAEAAQRHGVMVAATGQADDAVPYSAVDFTGPTLLMIGGERRGLRRSFLAQCEQVVTIPYGHGVVFPAALGTVAACAVLGFEIARQRASS